MAPWRHRKPGAWDALCAILRSEPVAWAAQNALGVVLTGLFTTVVPLKFTLACVAGIIFSICSTVLSLDRSTGGRVLGAVGFIGIVLPCIVISGGLVSLAWQAAQAPSLFEYLGLSSVPSKYTINAVKDNVDALLAGVANLQLPAPLRTLVDALLNGLYEDVIVPGVNTVLHSVGPAYYGLLVALFVAFITPATVARARGGDPAAYGIGIFIMVFVIVAGLQFAFATLTPLVGLSGFWKQVTGGYAKGVCIAAAAQLISCSLVFVTSTRDRLAQGLGAVITDTGRQLSRGASRMHAFEAALQDAGPPGKGAGVSREAGLPEVPALPKNVDLLKRLEGLKKLVLLAAFEPPFWPFCSAPALGVKQLKQLWEATLEVVVLAAATKRSAELLRACAAEHGLTGDPHTAALWRDVALLGGSVAAGLGQLGEALRGLGSRGAALRCAKGQPLLRRWQALSAEARAAAARVAAKAEGPPESGGLFAVGAGRLRQHGLLLMLATGLRQLQSSADELAGILAAAVAGPGGPALAQSGAKTGGPTKDGAELASAIEPAPADSGKQGIEASDGDVEAPVEPLQPAAADAAAPGMKPGRLAGVKEAVLARPWALWALACALAGCGVLTMGIYLQAVGVLIPKFLRSKEHRAKGKPGNVWRRGYFTYWLKFWFVVVSTETACIVFLWKLPKGDTLPQYWGNAVDIFLNWQPYYFWITAVLSIQMQVEGSILRGVLRAVPAVPLAVVGWLVMLNGTLAASPYWVLSMLALFNGLASVACVSPSWQYPTCAALFVFNAILLCQYSGYCCNAPGTLLYAFGKLAMTSLGAAWGLGISWLVAPSFTSNYCAERQAAGLRLLADALDGDVEALADGGACKASPRAMEGCDKVVKSIMAVSAELRVDTLQPQLNLVTYALLAPTPGPLRAALHELTRAAVLLGGLNQLMDLGHQLATQDDEGAAPPAKGGGQQALQEAASELVAALRSVQQEGGQARYVQARESLLHALDGAERQSDGSRSRSAALRLVAYGHVVGVADAVRFPASQLALRPAMQLLGSA